MQVFGEDLDAETLKDILQQCLMDIPPLAKTKSFFSFGRGKVAHQLPTENEIDRAAEYVIDRFGHLPGESEDEEDENGSNDQEEESCKVNHNVVSGAVLYVYGRNLRAAELTQCNSSALLWIQ